MKIFVYGTLRKGQWNHDLLVQDADAEFLCYARTKEPKILIDKGIPYLFNTDTAEDGAESVYRPIGEIYEVNNIAPIDRLESNGFHYQRAVDTFLKTVPSIDDDSPQPYAYEDTDEEIEAWVYYALMQVPTMTDFIEDFNQARGH